MHFSRSSVVLGSLALASLASAVPLQPRGDAGKPSPDSQPSGFPGAGPSGGPSGTYSQNTPPATSSAAAPSGSASGSNPFSFPLSNGFPNIQNPSDQLNAIQLQAHGTLPQGNPPPSSPPKDDDLTSLRLIAFNELWEVAFFTELLFNVTNNVPGFEFKDQVLRQTVINAITAVQAQEELHALNANGALAANNAGPIQPCKYIAPTADFNSSIGLAATFTDVVLGTLGDVQTKFGINGDNGLIRGVAAVIGQEGEQNGFYRSLLGKIPSALPFLTASTREFAFSALNQMFIVPGSCPNINTINLPIFGALKLLTQNVQPKDQTLQFSFSTSGNYGSGSNYSSSGDHSEHPSGGQGPYSGDQGQYSGGDDWSSRKDLNLVYINQQNAPIVQPIKDASVKDGMVTFSSNFPFTANLMNGLTIAVVTNSTGPFASVDDVAATTLFGPAFIELN